MELTPCRFLIQFLFLCFIVRRKAPTQASQEAQNTDNPSSSYFFYQRSEYPRDCKETQQQCSAQNSSRVYLIQPDGFLEPFSVYCEDEWTVIQRREDDNIDFNRNWREYNNGFGFLNSNVWIGNEKLSYLTNQKKYELMITFETATGDSYHVTYSMFRISDAFSDYKLFSVGEFTGTLGPLLTRPLADCFELQQAGRTTSGDYIVVPAGWSGEPFTVNCNMDIDDGGWTVFQRRIDGTAPFNRDWDTYKEGFGAPSGEFWMGNDKLAFLTNRKDYELRIDMINADSDDVSYSGAEGGESYYAKYDLFRISGESDKYRLIGLGDFTGTAEYDALRYHLSQAFSTIDRDNDVYSYHCASDYQSAWWYKSCYHCDLNSPFTGDYRAYWYNLPGINYIAYSEMKIRPVERTS